MLADLGLLLIRVDDRLLHGQVALGWGQQLEPSTFLIVDGPLTVRALEAELYRAAVPDDTRMEIFSPGAFLDEIRHGTTWGSAILLLRDIRSLDELVRGGYKPKEVNLGGIHEHPGARELLPYLFLSSEDWDLLEEMSAEGVSFFAQDLPNLRRYTWDWLRHRRPAEA